MRLDLGHDRGGNDRFGGTSSGRCPAGVHVGDAPAPWSCGRVGCLRDATLKAWSPDRRARGQLRASRRLPGCGCVGVSDDRDRVVECQGTGFTLRQVDDTHVRAEIGFLGSSAPNARRSLDRRDVRPPVTPG